jgi:transglutaminase-like putative cysteine protease
MRRLLLVALLVGLSVPAAFAQTSKAKAPLLKPLDEVWEAAYVRNDGGTDVKIGHVHMTSVPVDKDGKKLIRTTKELRFVVGRGDSTADLKADVSTDEDVDGKVHAIRGKIWLGKDRVQTIDAEVLNGNKVRVSAGVGAGQVKEYRWDPTNVGLAREQTLLREKQVKPGDEFTYRYYEVQVTHPITVRVSVKDLEEVALPGRGNRKLLKVVCTPEPLKLESGGKLQMPAASYWADPVSYDTIKSEMEIPGIGTVLLIRASKVAALAPNGQVPDLMKRQSIFLSRAIPDMHNRASIVYRVTVPGDTPPKELVSTNGRQEIKNASGKTFELHVTARRDPAVAGREKAGPEFLRGNYFINSDDPTVKEMAARAAGAGTDPWKKAQRIESFVHTFMRPAEYTEAMAPADHVAKTRTGDCTEYGMLTAALCRAVGIPSRTAIGLVYVNNLLGRPGLAFHMWTEVFVNGQWLGLDATLGRGSIGPGHIKITDHSWDGVISFTPLLPVQGFLMANPQIEVVGK